MSYRGDLRLGDTLDFTFATVGTTGAPTTLAGTPVVSAYVGNGTTEITAGITLTVDFDARTGLNHVRVVASAGNGFATATNVSLVITTGTVGGTSVVGYVIGSFSIENRSAVMPTVAARTLDVSATGEAGVDWANVGSPTTALALTGTTIATTQKVDIETIKTQAVTAAAGVTVLASVGTAATSTAQTGDSFARIGAAGAGLTGITGVTLAATTGLGNQTANITGNLSGSVGSVTAGVNATQISGSTAAADNLEAHALRAVSVTFSAGGTTTTAVFDQVDGATASATDDVYNGRVLVFSAPSGLKDQATSITDYVGATKTATIVAVTAAVGATAAAVMV